MKRNEMASGCKITASRSSRQSWLWGIVFSFLLIMPCFWRRLNLAGDLPSHVYNAWLAQLVEQGKAPGVFVVWQWQNAAFDLLLFYLAKLFGLGLASKVAVSISVLVLFWGVFALVRTMTGHSPWFLAPLIAMVSYGYVFHCGFFNFYMSVGLASFGLALVWGGEWKKVSLALLLVPLMLLAHPLGLLWFLGTAVYLGLWHAMGKWRVALPVAVIGLLGWIHLYLKRLISYQVKWPNHPFYQLNGADQLLVFGKMYRIAAVAAFGLALLVLLADRISEAEMQDWWKKNRLLLELYVVAVGVTAFLPQGFTIDPTKGGIGILVGRLTLVAAIFGICILGTIHRRRWACAGFTLVAIFYFSLIYRDGAFLERMEQNAELLTHQLPYGTRVLKTVSLPQDWRLDFVHVVEQACIGHCFVYSDYEPATQQFRIRAKAGSPIASAIPDDVAEMDVGNYVMRQEDLPMKQIFQCSAADLAQLCIRDLTANELNGGHRARP
jgi:hypothetical protein